MSEGYALEPAELDAIVQHLSNAQGELGDHQTTLATTPAAGRSSDETAKTFGTLAAALGGLAEQVGAMSSTLSANVADYRAAESRVERTFGQTRAMP